MLPACFWTVVLEKTFESPLDCKEIKPVNPEGNQSWVFIGRTGAEAAAPIFWPPDVKNWLIGKDPDAGKDWRQGEKGMTEDEMVGWHHQLDGHEVEQAPGVGDGQRRLVHGVAELDTTELNWTDLHTLVIYVYPLSSILCECLKDPACCCSLVAQSCATVWTPWTVAYQAALSMGSSRQEHRSELPFPSPEGSSIVPDI